MSSSEFPRQRVLLPARLLFYFCGVLAVVVVTVVCQVSWDSFSWLIVAHVGIIAMRTGDELPGRTNGFSFK